MGFTEVASNRPTSAGGFARVRVCVGASAGAPARPRGCVCEREGVFVGWTVGRMEEVGRRVRREIEMAKRWDFMREHMPKVVSMLQERRAKGEGAHLDECWKRGVGRQEPGWFYAREGGVTVGTPFEGSEAEQIHKMAGSLPNAAGQALLMLRPVEPAKT